MADLDVILFLITSVIFIVVATLLSMAYMARKNPDLSRHESEKYYTDPQRGGEEVLFPSIDDVGTLDLTVVVPAYNEEERLPKMLDEAISHLEKKQKQNPAFTYEIIVVDDGSKDDTTETALKYTEKHSVNKIRVLTLAKNRGKGGAVRMGILSGRGKQLLFADADGATQFADIDKLLVEMDKTNVNPVMDNMAIVCGSRAHLEKDSIAERALFRTFLMFGFHFLVWLLCVKGVRDTQCGFKLFTRDAARLLFYNMHVERWAFDVELLHMAEYFKIPISEVGVNWQEIEGSKLSPLWSSIQMGRDLVLIRLRYLIGFWQMDKDLKKAQ